MAACAVGGVVFRYWIMLLSKQHSILKKKRGNMNGVEIVFHTSVELVNVKFKDGSLEKYHLVDGLKFIRTPDGYLFVLFKEGDGFKTIALYSPSEWVAIWGQGDL